jgi:hypothetical protein
MQNTSKILWKDDLLIGEKAPALFGQDGIRHLQIVPMPSLAGDYLLYDRDTGQITP